MTENTTATATIDETTLSQTQRDMLALLRGAVSEAERVQPKKEKRSERDILISLVLDGTDEDVKGLSKFREILSAKAADIFSTENGGEEVSDDERKKVRTEAKATYDSAARVLTMFPLPEGFVVPDFPGARGGSSGGSGAGGEKPRNLKHTVTNAAGETVVENVTFAAISQKTKEPTGDLLTRFKSVAGDSKDEWENGPGTWSWDFTTGEGENAETYSVVTKYDAPAK